MIDAILFFLLSAISPGSEAQQGEFFPPGSLAEEPSVDCASADIIADYLEDLGELPLTSPQGSHEVYRLLWIPPFKPAIMVKVVNGRHITLRVGIHSVGSTKEAPVLADSKLESSEWNRFKREIDAAGFWSTMENKPRKPRVMVTDASYWIVEGVKDREYKVIQRTPPDLERDAEFVDLCLMMLELAGFDLQELGLLPRRPATPAPDSPIEVPPS